MLSCFCGLFLSGYIFSAICWWTGGSIPSPMFHWLIDLDLIAFRGCLYFSNTTFSLKKAWHIEPSIKKGLLPHASLTLSLPANSKDLSLILIWLVLIFTQRPVLSSEQNAICRLIQHGWSCQPFCQRPVKFSKNNKPWRRLRRKPILKWMWCKIILNYMKISERKCQAELLIVGQFLWPVSLRQTHRHAILLFPAGQ